ncbi:MAG: carboxypeptidase-like regulatory domain-containing protein [Planctomycetota bacterium]|nr:carboxypeptidase-like regulatory domain-containing protein [Planctomycetota bacterium]
MQKTTSSTIISVALLALLVWALSSGKKDAKPRKDSEAAQLAAKETPVAEEVEKTPIEIPPENEELTTANKPSGKELPEANPAPVAPPVAQQTPEEKAEPPENRPPPAPEIVPAPKASLKGIVTDGEGQPVAGVQVSLQKAGKSAKKKKDRQKQGGSSVLTDSKGAFEFRDIDLAPSVEFLASHLDYVEFQSKPFELRSGAALESFNIRLSEGGRINISVLGPDGAPRPGEDLSIWRAVDNRKHPWEKIKTRKADSEGKSFFAGLANDTYSLRAGGSRGTRHYTRLLRVTAGQALEQVIQLEPERIISGTVRNTRGEPVEGSLVKSFRTRPELGQDEKSSNRTNAEGQFSIGQLGDGKYLVTVQSKGYLRHSRMINAGEEVTLVLRQYGRISGQVISLASGKTITGSRLQLDPIGTQKGGQGLQPNTEGRFSSNSLLPGSYLLKVTAPGHTPASLDLEVKDGQNLELIIELEIPSP